MTEEGVVFREAYRECERCVRGCSDSVDRERQARLRCPIVPAARRRWHEPGGQLLVHMGGEFDETVGEPEPSEPNDEGCPGGWYRTAFAASVRRYHRPVAEGVYSPNLLLARCDDPLVHEAVTYFEHEQARHRAWAHEQIQRQQAARNT